MTARSPQQMCYDVAIVGAGPAGAATATHLARAGYHVVLVDRATFPRDKPCAEYLSPAAEPLLRELGVMEALDVSHPGRLRGFRIYAPGGAIIQGDFSATRDARGEPYFETGLAVPRLRLDALLVEAARASGAELRGRWSLARLSRDATTGDYILHPTSSELDAIRARLLIAADGVHSVVARRLGLHVQGRLRKIALVAHIRGIEGLSEYGEMHVAGRRYVGLAPLEPRERGDLCNVAMVVDEERDGRALAGRPQAFLLEALATFPALHGRLSSLTVTRPTLTTSGLSVRVRRISGERLLLVGDAAGYFDPFTGEGIYRALRGAQLAARVASGALAAGDLSAPALSAYADLFRHAFRHKRTVELLIQSGVQVPPLMDHFARSLVRRKAMADTVVAVTGDFVPPTAILRPEFLLRLVAG